MSKKKSSRRRSRSTPATDNSVETQPRSAAATTRSRDDRKVDNRARRTNRNNKSPGEPSHARSTSSTESTVEPISRDALVTKGLLAGLLLVTFLWAYWPTLVDLLRQWQRIPDYSHGFLVVPLAILFCWVRRDKFPGLTGTIQWSGAALLVIAAAMRSVSGQYYVDAIDGWSIPFWVGGIVLMLGGTRVFLWALPGILFLFFMVPLPYTLENMLAQPLQAISTRASTVALQSLGLAAVSEGHTILLGDQTLEVARACSGLRIFMGMAALAFAFVALFPRPWWTKVLMIASVLPIALVANVIRIVVTGWLFHLGMTGSARHLAHDVSGWIMIPLAAALFGLLLLYLDRLFIRVETVDPRQLVER